MGKIHNIISIIVLIFSLSINLNAETKTHSSNISENIGVFESSGNPDDYKLFQNFPNPFNPATIISYKINQSGFVTLKVYNLVGQMVGEIVNEFLMSTGYLPGAHSSDCSIFKKIEKAKPLWLQTAKKKK